MRATVNKKHAEQLQQLGWVILPERPTSGRHSHVVVLSSQRLSRRAAKKQLFEVLNGYETQDLLRMTYDR